MLALVDANMYKKNANINGVVIAVLVWSRLLNEKKHIIISE